MEQNSKNIYKPHKIDKRKKGTFWRHMVAGGIAGTISRTAVAPIERIKIILQTQNTLKVKQSEKYTGFFNALQRIPQDQGYKSLWRGNGANILRIAPNIAMRFSVYDKIKNYFMPKGDSDYGQMEKIFYHVLCGFSSGIMTMLVNYPFDVIRVRISVDMSSQQNTLENTRIYNGFMDCLKKMVKNEGFGSLYQGYTISLLGLAPYLAISFSTYDLLKNQFGQQIQQNIINNENNKNNENNSSSNKKVDQSNFNQGSIFQQMVAYFGMGSIAGTVAQVATQPLDVIRRRIQVNGSVNHERLYKGSMDCIKKTWKGEGIQGFYIGIGANLVKVAPAAAIQFTVYDTFKNFVFE